MFKIAIVVESSGNERRTAVEGRRHPACAAAARGRLIGVLRPYDKTCSQGLAEADQAAQRD